MRLKRAGGVILVVALLFAGYALLVRGPLSDAPSAPVVVRFEKNPIIVPEMLPGDDGGNINGPSLIAVPEWIENPLGKYYLYFAHHVGKYIRLAYADSLAGPWTVHPGGTLQIEETDCTPDTHIASPDVHVDSDLRRIVMYFHCPVEGEITSGSTQHSMAATSLDGLGFEAQPEVLGISYFRVFDWKDYTYAMGVNGHIYRSEDPLSGFEKGPVLFSTKMRHSAVFVRNDSLIVFYSNVGDNPERIMLSAIPLEGDWMNWQESRSRLVIKPEYEWEGAFQPKVSSRPGRSVRFTRQLRDPGLYFEEGRTFLLYSVGGEQGIAIAELNWE